MLTAQDGIRQFREGESILYVIWVGDLRGRIRRDEECVHWTMGEVSSRVRLDLLPSVREAA